jgi:hypothetical protein
VVPSCHTWLNHGQKYRGSAVPLYSFNLALRKWSSWDLNPGLSDSQRVATLSFKLFVDDNLLFLLGNLTKLCQVQCFIEYLLPS